MNVYLTKVQVFPIDGVNCKDMIWCLSPKGEFRPKKFNIMNL